ncbi:MAG: SDR family NAD(P)-dependent oxidoreductase [Bacillati bacterium ANGP1]|uniref:SDR family NAD(P)-dependent oxidoreductase n=1 Tax=Candidatus Segetimicrobium genomatis TaxID=2569760 RepID=A0A537JKR8_9BACT|nr:MAG: SDR family NAD(P)-dependent oxidoreductase [Terrabacteria group bacterium ANGP1]
MRRLTGKVALVTGAGRGIGRAIAKALAQEGASLVLHHLESAQGAAEAAEEAGRLGVPTLVARADVSLAPAVRNMFEEIHRTFGRLDILVNNAGVFSRVPLLEVAEAHWNRVLDVNLKGTFLCAQAAARVMLAQQSGTIVNLASGGGLSPRPGYETSAPYAASKAGVIMLTRRLALELAPSGLAPRARRHAGGCGRRGGLPRDGRRRVDHRPHAGRRRRNGAAVRAGEGLAGGGGDRLPHASGAGSLDARVA